MIPSRPSDSFYENTLGLCIDPDNEAGYAPVRQIYPDISWKQLYDKWMDECYDDDNDDLF